MLGRIAEYRNFRMASKRTTFRVRLASAIAGRQKALVPVLNPDGDGVLFPGMGGRTNS